MVLSTGFSAPTFSTKLTALQSTFFFLMSICTFSNKVITHLLQLRNQTTYYALNDNFKLIPTTLLPPQGHKALPPI